MSVDKTTCAPCRNQLHEKWEDWLHAVTSDDPNSLQNQNDLLVHDLVLLLMLDYAPWLELTHDGQQVRLSSTLLSHLAQTVRDALMQRIRRISEQKNTDHNKGVYSLGAVLTDMSAHAHLMTRANLFDVWKAPYETDPNTTGVEAISLRLQTEDLHRTIDQMTGTTSGNRAPDDTIPKDWFGRRIRRLRTRAERIMNFVDKYIAHAATPHSRARIAPERLKVHRALLYATVVTACRTTSELRVRLLDRVNCGSLARLDVFSLSRSNGGTSTVHTLEHAQVFFDKLVDKFERIQTTLSDRVSVANPNGDLLMECLREL